MTRVNWSGRNSGRLLNLCCSFSTTAGLVRGSLRTPTKKLTKFRDRGGMEFDSLAHSNVHRPLSGVNHRQPKTVCE